MTQQNKNILKILILASALLIWDQSYSNTEVTSEVLASTDEKVVSAPAIETLPKLKLDSTPAPAGLTAKAYLVQDLDSGKILTSQSIDEPLPVASLTKLTTALLVSRTLAPDTQITVPELIELPSPKLGLVPGEIITVASLVEGMLVASANDAAETLGVALGANLSGLMTDLAKSIGAENSAYANATGLDDPSGHSTARDLLKIILEIRRTPWLMSLLSETRGVVESVDGVYVHKFSTTNRLLRDGTVSGGKTGFTDEARGNLAVFAAAPGGSELIAILLGSESREDEMAKLLKWVSAAYQF